MRALVACRHRPSRVQYIVRSAPADRNKPCGTLIFAGPTSPPPRVAAGASARPAVGPTHRVLVKNSGDNFGNYVGKCRKELTRRARSGECLATKCHREPSMARNEKTSKRIGKVASKGLRGGKLTPKETRAVSGAALTQLPDKPKPRTKGPPKKGR